MSLAWARVLETLIGAVEGWADRADLKRICVVRDLKGCVRLAVHANPGRILDAASLEALLNARLGKWYAGPVLWTREPSHQEERRLAQNLLDRLRSTWPAGWPTGWSDAIGVKHPITTGEGGLWCGEQRARTKDAWLHEGAVKPPWPLHSRTPAIVSFYSFKGGVGRTTTLGIVARQLALRGHHVVVIDLDLEAPGLGRFFDIEETERGVLDLLSEHAATGNIDLEEPELYCRSIPQNDGKITVYPVGPMDWSYVERLACLDYAPQPTTGRSAVEAALRAMLADVKGRLNPDYIFLDARAGLHDLGGLSIHALAHVDVLVGRAGLPTRDGFQIVLEALARRREEQDLRAVIVQSFVPLSTDDYARVRDDWAASLYELFKSTIYARIYTSQGDDLPAVTDQESMHFPRVVPRYDSIEHTDKLQDIDQSVLDSDAFRALTARIVERCGRSTLNDPVDVDEDISNDS